MRAGIHDASCMARGMVRPSFVDVGTGRTEAFGPRHNTLSYMSAEAMAAAFGGDPSYIPARIGIIYGDSSTMPTGTDEISRYQDWDQLYEDLSGAFQGATVDVQVVDFSYAPSLGGEPRPDRPSDSSGSGDSSGSDSSADGGGDDYNHILRTGSNAITFHAVSNSQKRGVLFDSDTFTAGSYIYQCLLLGYHNGRYYILARAPLSITEPSSSGGGLHMVYLQKPKGFEVAIDWTVAFF